MCLGAEKNFLRFTANLAEKGYPVVDEDYFHRLIAKAIFFKAAEKVVGAQGYGGFRAQIVAFTLAWLSHRTAQRIDLDKFWREQKVSEALSGAIALVSKPAYDHIVNPPPSRRNPSEWSKREECWTTFRDIVIKLPAALEAELVATGRATAVGEARARRTTGPSADDPKVAAEIQRVTAVEAETWFNISRWAKETNNLLPWQRALAFSLGRLARSKRTPSAKQAIQGVKILDESERRGFSAGA